MLTKFHILPHDFVKMRIREQAVLYAFCDTYIKEKNEENKRINRKAKRK